MKNRFVIVLALLVLLVALTGSAQAKSEASTALVYVKIGSLDDLGRFNSTELPMYAMLDGGLLSGANQADERVLAKAGLTFQVLDPDLRSGTYYLAETRPGKQAINYSLFGQVLLTIQESVLLRMDVNQVDALTRAGAELRLVTLTPKAMPPAQMEGIFPEVVDPDPLVQVIMDQVTTEDVYQYDRELAGEIPVWVDGGWYTITTRNTNSGTPIQKATHYAGERFAADGLNVEYHEWSNATNPNVIGELPGLVNPEDIYIIGGHLDDVTGAPGADDNASGSVATMIAADILTQYQWGCTLRFALWTGEEQGLLGSDAYAHRAQQQGENILGYLNLDMIAWNTIGSSPTIYLGYGTAVPSSHDLALLFADVVDTYNINLLPVIGTNYVNSSDHGSFLDHGFTAILGIEGDDDFNPYYHGPGDTPDNTDPVYFTDYVKASLGTFAHMTDCLVPSGIGYLDGHVTNAAGGAPIEGAKVIADDGLGHSFPATADETGYYTRTLLAGTYAVSASAYGFQTGDVSGVEVTTDTVTTQDFTLTALPTYTISGYVKDSVTQQPLIGATVGFTDTIPVDPVTTDNNGFYTITVAEGTWHLKASAALHSPVSQTVVVSNNLAVDFSLDPLPCILLVDDDQDDPDVRAAYTAALDSLGYSYNVWDVGTNGDPVDADLFGYNQVFWFNGYPFSGSFTDANEAAVKAYLDAGGNFFLSSQDYLYEFGLTDFNQDYLHIFSFTSDVEQTTVTGQNVYSGLGPYSLSYPFQNYSDTVVPDTQAKIAFNGDQGTAAISFDGATFNTVFFGYPFEALPGAGRTAVMQRTVEDIFGGCAVPWAVSIDPPDSEKTGDPGTQVSHEFTITNLGPDEQDITLSVTGNAWQTDAPSSTGVLASGASTSITVMVTVPTDLHGKVDHFVLSATGVEGGSASADGFTTANVNPAVNVAAPAGGHGRPGNVVSYEFSVTNTGDYTDAFALEVSGVWPASLPGGNTTGPLAAGDSVTVTVLVEIPLGTMGGATDITNLTAISELDPGVNASAEVTTSVLYVSILPIAQK